MGGGRKGGKKAGGGGGGGYGEGGSKGAVPPPPTRRPDDMEEDDDESSGGLEGEPDEQEKQHFLETCWSCVEYTKDVLYDIDRLEATIEELDPRDAELWPVDGPALIKKMKSCVALNQRFLNQMPTPAVCGADLGRNGNDLVNQVPASHRVASRNSSKVRSTLRQFVRDWAVEGEAERQASYWPLIEAVQRHLPVPDAAAKGGKRGRSPRILVPGCGLARLPFELVRLGYAAQGNEFSYHMLLGSYLVLNQSPRPGCHVIFPFVLGTTNRKGKTDHLRQVRVPDICPCQVLGSGSEFSMAAGEFVQVYSDQAGEWDAVLSCFFLDTAKNIFLYIRTIAEMLRPGGFLINIGPLLYHYADTPHEISIELSWEEVKPAMEKYFDIVEEERKVSSYTSNVDSMMGVKYNCIFYVAKRNSVPVSGISSPVF